MIKKFDVIIVGASFSGLAVASRIKSGKVLLIDQKDIGVGCKSACGTLLYFVKNLKLEQSVLQVHKKIVFHMRRGTLEFLLEKPFCMIDPQKLTRELFKMRKAKNLKARVHDFENGIVKTDKGDFTAKIFVDASGPEAVLSSDRDTAKKHLSFGIETTLPYKEKGLHFWYEPKKYPSCVFWLFPQGETSRFGVASYQGKTKLKPALDEFLKRFKLKAGSLHGGYFPHHLRKPTVDNIFFVGDAAGECLPISGEGIRPAIIFGQRCGRIIDRVLLEKISLTQGLKEYQDSVLKRRLHYKLLHWGQKFITSIPESFLYSLAWMSSKKSITHLLLGNYLKMIENE